MLLIVLQYYRSASAIRCRCYDMINMMIRTACALSLSSSSSLSLSLLYNQLRKQQQRNRRSIQFARNKHCITVRYFTFKVKLLLRLSYSLVKQINELVKLRSHNEKGNSNGHGKSLVGSTCSYSAFRWSKLVWHCIKCNRDGVKCSIVSITMIPRHSVSLSRRTGSSGMRYARRGVT